MGLEALQHIGKVLGQAENTPRQTMLFSPRTGPGTVAQWRDLENVRYRSDGQREDIFLRGGTELVKSLSGGDIIQTKAFSARIDGVSTEYLAINKTTGFVLYNITNDTSSTHFSGKFTGDGKLWIESVGRFLIVIQPGGEQWQLDLKTGIESPWGGYSPAHIDSVTWIEGGDFAAKNVWGFYKDEPVICLDQSFESEFVNLPGRTALDHGARAVYKYTYRGGKYITVGGTEYKTDALFRLAGVTEMSYDGAGADVTLQVYYINAIQNGEIDFSPHRGTVYHVGDATGEGNKGKGASTEISIINRVQQNGNIFIEREENPILGNASGAWVAVPLTTSMSEADIIDAILEEINDHSDNLYLTATRTPTGVVVTETREGKFANGTLIVVYVDPGMEDIGSPVLPGGPGPYFLPMADGKDEDPFFGEVNTVSVTQKYDLPVNGLAHQNRTLVLPSTPDLEPLLEGSGKFYEGDADIELSFNFQIPVLHKAYLLVWEFSDGTFSVPGRPESISIAANQIMDGYEFVKRGIKIERSGPTPPDAVKLHLFATRWQLNLEDCFRPSERYPNGGFFHAAEFDPDVTDIEDFTADRDLHANLDAYIPKIAGILNMFGPGQISPQTILRSGDTLLLGGYAINRASTFTDHLTVVQSGSEQSGVSLGVVYEYSDKSKSAFLTYGTARATNRVRVHGANLLLSAIHLYLRSGTTYRHVRTVRPTDPEFYGMEITVGSASNYPTVSDPSGSSANHTVDLGGYVAIASPPQTVRIDAQFPLRGSGTIQAMLDMGLDEDRSQVVRRRFSALTTQGPVIGLVSAAVGEHGVTFHIDSQQADSTAPAQSPFAALSMGGNVFFQSAGGIYSLSRGVRLVASSDRYPELKDEIVSMAFNERFGELWVLASGGKALSIPFREDLQPAPIATIVSWAQGPGSLASASGAMYITLGGSVYQTDKEGVYSDAGQTLTGFLTSDHLCGWDEQLYIPFMELYGQGYKGRVHVDLQQGRFDGGSWQPFHSDITSTLKDLSMSGGEIPIYGRGISPRIRVELQAGEGRFSGLALTYEPILDNGINRR